MILPDSFSVSMSTFVLIAIAEIGDKSQLVCMTLAARHRHWPVILGATAALVSISALGIWAGRTLLQRFPLRWLHKFSGGLFLLFAMAAAWKALA